MSETTKKQQKSNKVNKKISRIYHIAKLMLFVLYT